MKDPEQPLEEIKDKLVFSWLHWAARKQTSSVQGSHLKWCVEKEPSCEEQGIAFNRHTWEHVWFLEAKKARVTGIREILVEARKETRIRTGRFLGSVVGRLDLILTQQTNERRDLIIKPSRMTPHFWFTGEGKRTSKFGHKEDNQNRTLSQKSTGTKWYTQVKGIKWRAQRQTHVLVVS